MGRSEDVPGPHQRPPALELEASSPGHGVADVDEPRVLTQLRLLPVDDPPLNCEEFFLSFETKMLKKVPDWNINVSTKILLY